VCVCVRPSSFTCSIIIIICPIITEHAYIKREKEEKQCFMCKKYIYVCMPHFPLFRFMLHLHDAIEKKTPKLIR